LGPDDLTIEQVSSLVVYHNQWMQVREDVIRRPDGSQGIYSYIDKPDFALVIPVERDGFHLVEQYRYPVSHRSWEFRRVPCLTWRMAIRRRSPGENWPRRPDCGLDGSTASDTFIRLKV
jgi:hypothetical protein